MANNLFSVTPEAVRSHHFPHLGTLSTDSVPTLATATEKVEEAASELDGRMRAEGIDPDVVFATATSAAYIKCRKIIRLAAAIELGPDGSASDAQMKRWKDDLKAIYADLDSEGWVALGAGVSEPTEESDGPHTHISGHQLETENPDDISTVAGAGGTPKLRRDDPM